MEDQRSRSPSLASLIENPLQEPRKHSPSANDTPDKAKYKIKLFDSESDSDEGKADTSNNGTWERHTDVSSGKEYYWRPSDGATQWHCPNDFSSPAKPKDSTSIMEDGSNAAAAAALEKLGTPISVAESKEGVESPKQHKQLKKGTSKYFHSDPSSPAESPRVSGSLPTQGAVTNQGPPTLAEQKKGATEARSHHLRPGDDKALLESRLEDKSKEEKNTIPTGLTKSLSHHYSISDSSSESTSITERKGRIPSAALSLVDSEFTALSIQETQLMENKHDAKRHFQLGKETNNRFSIQDFMKGTEVEFSLQSDMLVQQDTAATAIQARYRGHHLRQHQHDQHKAATAVQAQFRGHWQRQQHLAASAAAQQQAEADQAAAATAIQARYRGHHLRQHQHDQHKAATAVQAQFRGHWQRGKLQVSVASVSDHGFHGDTCKSSLSDNVNEGEDLAIQHAIHSSILADRELLLQDLTEGYHMEKAISESLAFGPENKPLLITLDQANQAAGRIQAVYRGRFVRSKVITLKNESNKLPDFPDTDTESGHESAFSSAPPSPVGKVPFKKNVKTAVLIQEAMNTEHRKMKRRSIEEILEPAPQNPSSSDESSVYSSVCPSPVTKMGTNPGIHTAVDIQKAVWKVSVHDTEQQRASDRCLTKPRPGSLDDILHLSACSPRIPKKESKEGTENLSRKGAQETILTGTSKGVPISGTELEQRVNQLEKEKQLMKAAFEERIRVLEEQLQEHHHSDKTARCEGRTGLEESQGKKAPVNNQVVVSAATISALAPLPPDSLITRSLIESLKEGVPKAMEPQFRPLIPVSDLDSFTKPPEGDKLFLEAPKTCCQITTDLKDLARVFWELNVPPPCLDPLLPDYPPLRMTIQPPGAAGTGIVLLGQLDPSGAVSTIPPLLGAAGGGRGGGGGGGHGRRRVLQVSNPTKKPITVGPKIHFYQATDLLHFDRKSSWGFQLKEIMLFPPRSTIPVILVPLPKKHLERLGGKLENAASSPLSARLPPGSQPKTIARPSSSPPAQQRWRDSGEENSLHFQRRDTAVTAPSEVVTSADVWGRGVAHRPRWRSSSGTGQRAPLVVAEGVEPAKGVITSDGTPLWRDRESKDKDCGLSRLAWCKDDRSARGDGAIHSGGHDTLSARIEYTSPAFEKKDLLPSSAKERNPVSGVITGARPRRALSAHPALCHGADTQGGLVFCPGFQPPHGKETESGSAGCGPNLGHGWADKRWKRPYSTNAVGQRSKHQQKDKLSELHGQRPLSGATQTGSGKSRAAVLINGVYILPRSDPLPPVELLGTEQVRDPRPAFRTDFDVMKREGRIQRMEENIRLKKLRKAEAYYQRLHKAVDWDDDSTTQSSIKKQGNQTAKVKKQFEELSFDGQHYGLILSKSDPVLPQTHKTRGLMRSSNQKPRHNGKRSRPPILLPRSGSPNYTNLENHRSKASQGHKHIQLLSHQVPKEMRKSSTPQMLAQRLTENANNKLIATGQMKLADSARRAAVSSALGRQHSGKRKKGKLRGSQEGVAMLVPNYMQTKGGGVFGRVHSTNNQYDGV